ncbi:2-amino-4-hydroxy-6-hydroxymethyldihydropteridine diphosphokinase [Dysgonomonas sp. ZJ709]|uniref:2-amino-4-hydroxy-6- hydroxymethyldihydropteridine diphosphokinase n=1 Tax=Dysgonomonas sp. ZJ709 TaxID=2709797 RepID=UPI0013EDF8BB|nr:2-amino-4-hydroxy-6-hydroxymethyldihydropteridine diphosphokinase [Dysgonomonas sp. ZJ709]
MLEKETLHDVYLGLGTNLGNKTENLNQALINIEERIGKIIASSAFYATKPVGFDSENEFLNAACHVQTKLSPLEILQITQAIEKDLGRNSKSKDKIYSDRLIDIDILLYDDVIIEEPNFVLPHPHLHERMFVLQPLAEIGGGCVHPIFDKTINRLLEMKRGV